MEKRAEAPHPIPQDLWNAAVSCAERYSLCTISSSLRLNYTDLKARIRERITPAFIEVTGHIPTACTITMEKPSGERMTITGMCNVMCNVMELTREFLR